MYEHVAEFSFVMRPPSLIAAACICSAFAGLTGRTCSEIIRTLHQITAIDEVWFTETLLSLSAYTY